MDSPPKERLYPTELYRLNVWKKQFYDTAFSIVFVRILLYHRSCHDICVRCCKLGMSSSFEGKTNIKIQAFEFVMGHQFVTAVGRVLHLTITATLTGNTMLKHNRTKIKRANGLLIRPAPKTTMACRNSSGTIFYTCRKPHQPCVLIWCKVWKWEECELRIRELKLLVASCRFKLELTFLHSPNGSSYDCYSSKDEILIFPLFTLNQKKSRLFYIKSTIQYKLT